MSRRKVLPTFFKAERTPLRVKPWRLYRGMGQVELAEASGVSQSLISQLEHNSTDWTGDTLARLAFALNCSEIDLLTRNPDDPEGLGRAWDTLNARERRQLVAIIKGLKQAT